MVLYLTFLLALYGLCVRIVMKHDFMNQEPPILYNISSVVPSNTNMAVVRASAVSATAASLNVAAGQ
jgi:hypothetical protein